MQIQRIQNRKLCQHYCSNKQQMQERWAHDSSLTLEQDLWHGTRYTKPALIYTDEYGTFCLSVCMFVYLSEYWCITHLVLTGGNADLAGTIAILITHDFYSFCI